MNVFPQFKVPLHDIDLHFLHVPGVGPNPYPLLLMHGWPGSVFEFLDIIPRLTDPARFGGDPKDAFTVIAPSLPGYGLSFRPGQKRFILQDIAACLHDLMTEVLGLQKFAAQGGDWGAGVASLLGQNYASSLLGIHLNLLFVPREKVATALGQRGAISTSSLRIGFRRKRPAISRSRAPSRRRWRSGSPTRPPVWPPGSSKNSAPGPIMTAMPESAISRDRMLANISLYWFTAAIGSSFWPYYGRLHRGLADLAGSIRSRCRPAMRRSQRKSSCRRASIAEKTYTNIQRWTEMKKGGHFAAMEQPAALAEEIQEFFRPLRAAI